MEIKHKSFDNSFNTKQHINKFFNNWVIHDSIDSKSGPSNWQVENDCRVTQHSSIYSESGIATTLLYTHNLSNIYSSIVFTTNNFGNIPFLFKYIDSNNFVALEFMRTTLDSGQIKIYSSIAGKKADVEVLACEKMLSVFPKCFGYEISKENKVEIYSYNKGYLVLVNDMVIFNKSHDDDNGINNMFFETEGAKFGIALSGQNSFAIKDLSLKDLSIEDYIKLTKLQSRTNIAPSVNSTKSISISSTLQEPDNLARQQVLKYNPLTNSFEEDNITLNNNTITEAKDNNNINVSTIAHDKSAISDTTSNINKGNNPQINILEMCLKFEKETYICNYLNNLFESGKTSIKEDENKITELIKTNCLSTMKNPEICNKIITKLTPVIFHLILDN
jgi:hypothetical protein